MAELDEVSGFIAEAERSTSAGDHTTAERSLRRALQIQEAALGLDHPDVATTLNDLGKVCERLGRPEEAEFLYRRALGIARRTLNPNHPSIATSLGYLSDLYRVQGKLDKLEKIAEGRPVRSGLPAFGLPEDDGVGQPPTGPPEVTVVPDSVPQVPPVAADSSPSSRWLGALVYPGILLGGIAVVVLSSVWLWLGGTPTTAPSGSAAAVSEAPLLASAADEADVAPPLDRTTTARDAESGASVAEPDAGSADGVDQTRDEGPSVVAAADVTATLATDAAPSQAAVGSSSTVVDARVCSQLATRDADGSPLADWQCATVTDDTNPGPLSFYTRVRSATRSSVAHRWFREGALSQTIDLQIEANTGPGYRTYSSRTVAPAERGAWRVELVSSDGEVLFAQDFQVR